MKIDIDTKGIFNKLIWMIISCSILFCAKKVNDMSNSIADLNMKMTTVIVWQNDKTEYLKDHEQRIRLLEGKTHAPVQ